MELGPGYCLIGSHDDCLQGDILGRLCAPLHLPWGAKPRHTSLACPPHSVELARSYWIAATELTYGQFERFDAHRERHATGPRDPITGLDRETLTAYCAWLSTRGDLVVRLPTAIEWENACRAGSATAWCSGNDDRELAEYAWFATDTDVHEVGTRRPNAWGLYDMHGNVMETCSDIEAALWVPSRNVLGDYQATDMETCTQRRGGYFLSGADECRSWYRRCRIPSSGLQYLGFRPAADSR